MDFVALFEQELQRPRPAPEILALAIAGLAYPTLDIARQIERLDEMGRVVTAHLDAVRPGRARADAFLAAVTQELGFHGNADNYYAAENSFLNVVLVQRTGLPILLSLICMALGRRAGVTVEGVGFPGHFMARIRDNEDVWLLDPFHGAVLSTAEAPEYLASIFGRSMVSSQAAYGPVTPAALAHRILNNLLNVYVSTQNFTLAARVMDYQLILLPASSILWYQRAMLHHHVGDLERTSRDLQRYFYLKGLLWRAFELDEQKDEAVVLPDRERGLLKFFRELEAKRRRLN